MSGSIPSVYGSGKVSDFISYLERKLIDESLATFQREQISGKRLFYFLKSLLPAAIENLESAFEVNSPTAPLSSPSGTRRNSAQVGLFLVFSPIRVTKIEPFQSRKSISSAVLEEVAEHPKKSEQDNEEEHAAALLRKAMQDDKESIKVNKSQRKSLLEVPRNEDEPFSLLIKSTHDEYQVLHSSSIMTNLFGTSENKSSAFFENSSRRPSDLMENTIHKFCEQFAKRL